MERGPDMNQPKPSLIKEEVEKLSRANILTKVFTKTKSLAGQEHPSKYIRQATRLVLAEEFDDEFAQKVLASSYYEEILGEVNSLIVNERSIEKRDLLEQEPSLYANSAPQTEYTDGQIFQGLNGIVDPEDQRAYLEQLRKDGYIN